jgi:AraC-like DNA-binding protein
MVAGTNSRLAQAHISGGALHIRGFIDRNLHRTIHVRDLAAVVQRSPAHFARSFKQTFGDPPHAYVTRMRLHKSCHLMVTTSATVVEIALATGFSDQSHLCRLFRKTFGQSPSRWRREFEIQETFDGIEWETLDKHRSPEVRLLVTSVADQFTAPLATEDVKRTYPKPNHRSTH